MFPTIPTTANGRILSTTQANTTAQRNFPDLSGLTKNAGDLLIAIAVGYQTTSGSGSAYGSWGLGFTELLDNFQSGTSMTIGIAYKWSTGSESGTWAVTQSTTIAGHAGLIVMSIEGAHGSQAPNTTSAAFGTTAAADPASLSPGWGAEDTLWISVAGGGETGTAGSFGGVAQSPTNYGTDHITAISQDVVGGVNIGVGFRQLNAASEDVGTWSVDTSNARNVAALIAVRPAPEIPYMSMHPQSPKQFPDRSVLERRVW